jgi:uncharacterized Zn finger protein
MTIIQIQCEECGVINEVPKHKLYDGFEGDFACKECGANLGDFASLYGEGDE